MSRSLTGVIFICSSRCFINLLPADYPANIAGPIRSNFRRRKNAKVVLGFSANCSSQRRASTLHPVGCNRYRTDRTYHTVYNEIFGLLTDGFEDDEERPIVTNVGLDFYVLGIRAGTGRNRDAEDLFFGVGGGFRF